MLTLSALDQLPVFRDLDAPTAVRESVTLAVALEGLGYHRFWVAEHHGDPSRACAAPDVLAASIAARTTTLRVGTGCTLLPYTSPLRTAEAHRLLAALAPGRIDLGIGRGQGTAAATAALLPAYGTTTEAYESQVAELLQLLGHAAGSGAPMAVPLGASPPEPWLMGSSSGGARTAASFGLPFAFAQFAHPSPRPDIVEEYRSAFRPGPFGSDPQVVIAVRISCAPTRVEAEELAAAVWWPIQGRESGPTSEGWPHDTYPSRTDLAGHRRSPEERACAESMPWATVTGDPGGVMARLTELADVYGADELVLTTTCPGLAERIRMYELVAGANRRPA
ncbi:luciferase family oxidoreductase, group 1 [Raineyella antarctica]|uniref:Luciferase family oxidoreductase, group 1 n=1 Tax=Raineyella antarctica TaxID=1577474 RepID=A0A1G6HBZ5_9ACTN|nr:MsnO8 family LLM class oxidoreductase [Raineyella antarctica]SDB91721.1 luciferase family oxidoreductase, group 1 [Raineyella antarctica]